MKKLVSTIIILIALGALAWYFLRTQTPSASPTPMPSATFVFSPTPEGQKTASPTPRPATSFRGPTGLTKPATCTIGGQIIFRQTNLYESKNIKFDYQNVDDEARLIDWSISPNDSLRIGPNIFVALPLPSGSWTSISVGLPQNPIARSYILHAAIHYGQLINGSVVIKEAKCSGSIAVQLTY